jgi:hypothetical protein
MSFASVRHIREINGILSRRRLPQPPGRLPRHDIQLFRPPCHRVAAPARRNWHDVQIPTVANGAAR